MDHIASSMPILYNNSRQSGYITSTIGGDLVQITRQTEYAIRTLLELAKVPKGEVLQVKLISDRQSIPVEFLKKTVQLLALAGLVSTRRGTQGGIMLARPAEDITIADIVKAIEGPVAINLCLEPGYVCPNQGTCPVSPVLARAQGAFLRELQRESLADLVKPGSDKASLLVDKGEEKQLG
jgi:Rrf2 family protein